MPEVMTVRRLVGRNLIRLRKKKGLRQDEFGEALGRYLGRPWDRQTVGKAEARDENNSRRIDVEELVAFSHVLGCSIAAFFESEPGDTIVLGDREMPARDLAASFLSPETQERLGSIYELGAFRKYATDVRTLSRELRELLAKADIEADSIDQIAADWEALIPAAKPRKRPKGRSRGGRKK